MCNVKGEMWHGWMYVCRLVLGAIKNECKAKERKEKKRRAMEEGYIKLHKY